jgi:hypothetical protein
MDKIASALVKAQKAFGPALKDKTNPAFRSKYADLGACIEAVIDALNANGIALIQKQHPHDGGVCVETVFVHESGETFSAGLLSVPAAKQDPQGYGSALTYARRYSLMAACGIAPEDDDGNAASKTRQMSSDPTKNQGRAARLESQRAAIFNAATVGDLKAAMNAATQTAMSENDSAAVDQLNAWAEEKRAQAKPKVAT